MVTAWLRSGGVPGFCGELVANPAQASLLDFNPFCTGGPVGAAEQHAAAAVLVEQGEVAGLAAAQQ
jgi:hypothetical protein